MGKSNFKGTQKANDTVTSNKAKNESGTCTTEGYTSGNSIRGSFCKAAISIFNVVSVHCLLPLVLVFMAFLSSPVKAEIY